jgi:uncharacterized protein (TIRG00374 family)
LTVKFREMARQRLGLIVRLFFSIALIVGLGYNIGSTDILTQLNAVRWHVVAIAVIVLSSSVLLVTPRWTAILSALGYPLPPTALIRSVFVGFSFNQLLPTGFGGDVMRVLRARQLGVPTDIAVHSVLIDRASGVFISFVGAVALLPWMDSRVATTVAWIIGMTALAGIFICLLFWGLKRLRMTSSWLASVQRELDALGSSIQAFTKRPALAVLLLLVALANQLLPAVAIWLLASELHVIVGPLDIAMITFVATLAATVPISVAGWGVREGALVFLFGLYGVRSEVAFAVSVLYGVSLTLMSVPGLFLIIGREGLQPTTGKSNPI